MSERALKASYLIDPQEQEELCELKQDWVEV